MIRPVFKLESKFPPIIKNYIITEKKMSQDTGKKPSFDYVRLDVGGHLFTASKQTLQRFEDSFFAKLVLPENDRRKSELDFITIDRDGKHFGSILEHLRDSLSLVGWTERDLNELGKEADYYGLVSLTEEIESKIAELEGDELAEILPEESFVGFFSKKALMKFLQKRDHPATVIKIRDGNTDLNKVNRRLHQLSETFMSGITKFILFENKEIKEIGVCERCEKITCSTDCSSRRLSEVGPKVSQYSIYTYDPRESSLREIQTFCPVDYNQRTNTGTNDNNHHNNFPARISADLGRSNSRNSLTGRRNY